MSNAFTLKRIPLLPEITVSGLLILVPGLFNTFKNAESVQEHIAKKLPATCSGLNSRVEYQPFFWYTQDIPTETCERPSEILNIGFLQVGHYVERYLKHIHKEFTLPEVENDTFDEEHVQDDNDIEVMY